MMLVTYSMERKLEVLRCLEKSGKVLGVRFSVKPVESELKSRVVL